MRPAVLVGVVALAASSARAGDGVTGELQGYLEARGQAVFGLDHKLADLPLPFDSLGFQPDEDVGAVLRLRPTLKLHLGEVATAVAAVEAHSYHGFFDRDQSSVGDVVSLERLYFTTTVGPFDLSAGRQLIAWGNGLVANPTGWFDNRQIQDPWAEGTGVWGLRALAALTDTMNVTAVAATFPGNCCEVAVAGRFDATFGTTDTAATVIWDEGSERVIFGLDVKGEAEVGLWAESAATLHTSDESWDFTVEAGVDYTFDVLSGWYLAAEYIFQSGGVTSGYLDALMRTYVTDPVNDPPALLGEHSVALISRLTFTEDWRLQVTGLANVTDPSGQVLVHLTWLPTGSLELTAGANVAWGEDGGEYTPALPEALGGYRIRPQVAAFLWGRFYY